MLFLDALSREDWQKALMVYPASGIPESIKQWYGGLKVISIGKPFRSWPFAADFMPYEIKLRSGMVKKFNLAVRNDNPAHRWVFDGGL